MVGTRLGELTLSRYGVPAVRPPSEMLPPALPERFKIV